VALSVREVIAATVEDVGERFDDRRATGKQPE
jgi:hypothetical protein